MFEVGFHLIFMDVVNRMMQFPSRQAYDNAIRVIGRKGRLYRLERVMF